ncbi:MAG: hypothetical protein ACKOYM_01790 [Actinomycetes bacterium]
MSSEGNELHRASVDAPDAVCRGWWSGSPNQRAAALFILVPHALGVSVTDERNGEMAPPEWIDLARVVSLDALGAPAGGLQPVELGLSDGAVAGAGWTDAFCDAVVRALHTVVANQRQAAAGAAAPAPPPSVDPFTAPPSPVAPAAPAVPDAPPATAPAPVAPAAPVVPPPVAPVIPPPFTGAPPPPLPAAVSPATSAPASSALPTAPPPPPAAAGGAVSASSDPGATLVIEDVVYLSGHPAEPKKRKRCTATMTGGGAVIDGPSGLSISLPWTSVATVEAQNADEARFRLGLRVHRDATALVVSMHDGTKVLLEARDCDAIPLRSAISELLVNSSVEVQ